MLCNPLRGDHTIRVQNCPDPVPSGRGLWPPRRILRAAANPEVSGRDCQAGFEPPARRQSGAIAPTLASSYPPSPGPPRVFGRNGPLSPRGWSRELGPRLVRRPWPLVSNTCSRQALPGVRLSPWPRNIAQAGSFICSEPVTNALVFGGERCRATRERSTCTKLDWFRRRWSSRGSGHALRRGEAGMRLEGQPSR